MSLVKEQHLFALDVAKLFEYLHKNDIIFTLGEAYRTKEQQAIYVKQGLSKTSKSNHLRRLAIDLNFFIDGKLCFDKAKILHVGTFWEKLNLQNRWGGNFRSFVDVPHFERNVTF